MSKVIKVGIMPGRISEVVVEEGATVADVLELAGLDATGYEIKVDGTVSSADTATTASSNLVLLTKQVKGNAGRLVKVGIMPGRISEVATAIGTSVADLISEAGLDGTGYEVKVDGNVVNPSEAVVTEATNLVLLTKQVKGN